MTDAPISIGDPCPDFALPLAGGGTASLADYAGRSLLLYFYPRADTPGCTTQAVDFTAMQDAFAALDTAILAVSKDPVAKLEKFAAKRELGIPLASDADSDLCERMGVWVEKTMYGKTYHGIERSTFLVGPDGRIDSAHRKVRAKGHADAMLEIVREQHDPAI